MIDFLKQLIQIVSISPRDMGCFDLIEERLNKLNFNCERINYLNVEKSLCHIWKESYLFLGPWRCCAYLASRKLETSPFSGH